MNSHTLKVELQRNVELKNSDLEVLKKWLVGKINLPQLADQDLALFLHRNHYDVKTTKLNIERYFTMRTEMPEYFTERDLVNSEGLKQATENVGTVVLPKRTPEGYNVVLMQLLNSDPNRYEFDQAVKYLNMVLDIHVYENGTSNGYLYLCDIKGATPEHLDRLPIQGLKKFFDYLTNGTHFRWMGMHYVNSSSKDDAINDYVRKKIVEFNYAEKVYLYDKVDQLENIVPVKLLPDEMGGSAGHLQELHLAQCAKIKDYKAWFKMESRMRVNAAEQNIDENDINEMNNPSTNVC